MARRARNARYGAGQTRGGGVFRAATKRSTRSNDELVGGVPNVFAGALAHHGTPVPRRSFTAIAPCCGSFSVYVHAVPPARIRSRFARTTIRMTGSVRDVAAQR